MYKTWSCWLFSLSFVFFWVSLRDNSMQRKLNTLTHSFQQNPLCVYIYTKWLVVNIFLTHKTHFPTGPLKVVVPTESVSSYLGDTALLRCEVSGDPTPVIRWQKNREDLPLTFEPDSRLAVLPSGSLQVSRVQPPDSATYRCLADNPSSTRTGTDAELRVLPGNWWNNDALQTHDFRSIDRLAHW